MSWLEGWRCRRSIVITNPANGYSWTADDPFVWDSSVFDYRNEMKSDFSDMRFTLANGKTLLSICRTGWTAKTDCRFAVKVSGLPAGSSITIYMYWGNPAASSVDDDTITGFLDDFSDGEIDDTKWTTVDSEMEEIVRSGGRKNGYLALANLDNGPYDKPRIISSDTFGPGTEVLFRAAFGIAYTDGDSSTHGYRVTEIGLATGVCAPLIEDRVLIRINQGVFAATRGTAVGAADIEFDGPDFAFWLDSDDLLKHPYVYADYRIRWMADAVKFYMNDVLIGTATTWVPQGTDLTPILATYGWLYERRWIDRISYFYIRTCSSNSAHVVPTAVVGDPECVEAGSGLVFGGVMATRLFMLGDQGPYKYDDSKTLNLGTRVVYAPGDGKIAFVDGSPPTITDSDESFITTGGLASGDVIRVERSAKNDGLYHVVTAAEGTLTLHADHTLTDETPSGVVVISTVLSRGMVAESLSGEEVLDAGRPTVRYALMLGG